MNSIYNCRKKVVICRIFGDGNMQKMTMNVLMSLIVQCKIIGRGITSNGRLYVMLMEIIADHDNINLTSEESILNKFNNEITHHSAYRKLERFLSRFIKTGQGYPYKLFRFKSFEDVSKYTDYLNAMRCFVDTVLDKTKLDSLVYTLLEIIRQDTTIDTIMYGNSLVSKEQLFGNNAHPKKICVEALLLGLLYHVHIKPDIAICVNLIEAPEKRYFQIVQYIDNEALNLNLPINLIENIHETANRQKPAEVKYELELSNDNVFPVDRNVYIFGSGGAGKSTYTKSMLGNKNTVNFYFPLYRYNYEVHTDYSGECCHILLQILLKYHYQYEYDTYDSLIANEGKTVVLRQLTELDSIMKRTPVNNEPAYTLLLDGINEMSANMQSAFIDEIEWICSQWRNVRIIVASRTVLNYRIFDSFFKAEILGVSEKLLHEILVYNNAVPNNEKMLEILKKPLFLNMYLKNNGIYETRGELLDSYIMNWNGGVAERFMLQFSIPLACKRMLEDIPKYEITRGDLLEIIDKSIKIYINDEYVYQDYVFPYKINKDELLKSRTEDNWIEILVNKTGLLVVSEYDVKSLQFAHQYYQEYFAAKHVINAINIFEAGCKIAESEKEYFSDIALSGVWFDYFRKFPDKKEIYNLVAELCGEYKNNVDANIGRNKNLLDRYLDICRMYDVEYSLENIFIIMKIIHKGVIWEMNFDYLNLPIKITSDFRFNLNGEYPCTFMSSCVRQIEIDAEEPSPKRFKDCDFYDAVFFDIDTKVKLSKLGALCDFEDNKFISSLRRELILTWNDVFDMM